MKRNILKLIAIAAVFGSVITGCSSQKNTSGSDSTMKDTSKVSTTTSTTSSSSTDTTKKDTSKKPPR